MKIAIYGPMCSGKTTVANIIKELEPRYEIFSFGKKIKDIASDLFEMEGKNRSLLINIADKMREIDEDIWAKYIIKQTKSKDFCIIDDLRFQNELNYLDDWIIISLITSDEIRIQRLKKLYPDNYEDHIKNMQHKSETDTLIFPKSKTFYLDTNIHYDILKSKINEYLNCGLKTE
jgi:cytidylate kinase